MSARVQPIPPPRPAACCARLPAAPSAPPSAHAPRRLTPAAFAGAVLPLLNAASRCSPRRRRRLGFHTPRTCGALNSQRARGLHPLRFQRHKASGSCREEWMLWSIRPGFPVIPGTCERLYAQSIRPLLGLLLRVCSEHTCDPQCRKANSRPDATVIVAVSKPEIQAFGEKTVIDHELDATKTDANSPGKRTEPRRPRSIRFSDSEWSGIELAAKVRGMTAADLVRHAAVSMAADKVAADFEPLPPEIVAQIERIYRGVYLISTLQRDQLVCEGRQEELERIQKSARESQTAILTRGSPPAS